MSWLSVFFRKDSVKAVLEIGKSLLKIFIGKSADYLQEVAREEVFRAEQTGKTGLEKYEIAYKNIKSRLPQIKESVINLAIEIAVNWLSATSKK